MREAPRGRAGAHALAGAIVAAIALGALLAGAEAFSIFVTLVLLLAYAELRRVLAPGGSALTIFIGGAGVLGFHWVGYDGRLERLAWVGAGLVLVLLATGVVLNEVTRSSRGTTEEVASTLAAAGLVGVLGAHVLLIRSVPEFGFRGVLAFGLMALLNDAFAFMGGRALGKRPLAPRLSPGKTWEGAVCGLGASLVVGIVVGLVLDPPFDMRSGVAFGTGVGMLAPLGDLAFSALKRSAGVKESGRTFGPLGGALDAVDGLLMTAPAFYWAFRTIAI